MCEPPYEVDYSSGLFTRGLSDVDQAALYGVMKAGLGEGSNHFLSSKLDHLLFLSGLWQWEAEARCIDEEQQITQFEFSIITYALMAYSDFVGVGCGAIWDFFCEVTDNPLAGHSEQVASKNTSPVAATMYHRAYGEIERIRLATPRNNLSGEVRTIGDDAIEIPLRFDAPACPECGDTDTHVASSPARFRRLHCRKCGHYWKLAK